MDSLETSASMMLVAQAWKHCMRIMSPHERPWKPSEETRVALSGKK
jgi:hypothetical protein